MVTLQGAEAHHMTRVCRLRAGDHVYLFNGDGREYPAQILSADRRTVELGVAEPVVESRELQHKIMVAAPVPKGDRGQFLVEKLTELGVNRFVPLQTERSVVHLMEARHERLSRYVIEASKQCRRNVLMQIEPTSIWEAFCTRIDLPSQRLLAHPEGSPASCLSEDLAIAVGPEGGFTAEEVRHGIAAGWRPVSLGTRILRIETAAIALAALASLSIASS